MALVNVAWILASAASAYWDLEAPGPHRYFHPFLTDKELSGQQSQGVIEMAIDSAARAAAPMGLDEKPEGKWYLPYPTHRLSQGGDPRSRPISFFRSCDRGCSARSVRVRQTASAVPWGDFSRLSVYLPLKIRFSRRWALSLAVDTKLPRKRRLHRGNKPTLIWRNAQ
jgi:hypothetical protein